MKHLKQMAVSLVLALALLVSLTPARAVEDAPEEAEAVVEQEEVPAVEEASTEKRSNPLVSVIIVLVVAGIVVTAATEIRRDNRRKEAHG